VLKALSKLLSSKRSFAGRMLKVPKVAAGAAPEESSGWLCLQTGGGSRAPGSDRAHHLRVEEARADPPVDLFQRQVGRDDRREAVGVAMVEDLEQLLARPIGGVLRSEVIEDQKRRLAHLLKAVVEGRLFIAVGRPERIQQVGHSDEKGGDTQSDAGVGDGGGEVGLPAAVPSLNEEPAWRARE
jgi:hypothetical protein